MNGSKLMDALQFIDDDLLGEAQKMRDKTAPAAGGRRRTGRTVIRRLPYIAALAAASLLAVFTLRFVTGKNLMGNSGSTAGAPQAEEAAAAAEAYMPEAAVEEETEEAAPAEAAAATVTQESAAEQDTDGNEKAAAGAGGEVMYDMAEKAREDAGETQTINAEAASMAMAQDERAGDLAAAEAAPAAEEAMMPAEAEMPADAENREDKIRSFIDTALAGETAVLDEPPVRFDGSEYTLRLNGAEYSYPYLLTETYTDDQGKAHTVRILSVKDEMTESEIQTAVKQGISAEKGYILTAE